MKVQRHHLDGLAALAVAETETLGKFKDERDTEFVKRIVCAYINAHNALNEQIAGQEKSDG